MKKLLGKHVREVPAHIFGFSWKLLLVVFFLIMVFYLAIAKDLPSPRTLESSQIPESTQIFDRNGTLLYTIYGQKNQTFVPLSDIPKHMQEATIAVEDRNFYHHGAVDLRGIARAALRTLFYNDVQGGSTLTQQLVKNSLLSPERTITRKVKEVILAFATEAIYSKDQILEMYLNQSPYGGTAWGVEAAAQTYFGKHAKELDLTQAALLAGLPESPSRYSPFGARPELAKRQQRQVLKNLLEQGYISKEQYEDAIKKELKYKQLANTIRAPHFVFYVKELLAQKYGERMTQEGGLRVTTSLDLPTQEFAQLAVASEVAKLKGFRVGNAAALITNPATGEILAMVGSKDYFDETIDGNVNVTTAHRQPGSSIKPINYATGLIKGLTAATPLIDRAICFPSPGLAPYCPRNYDGKFRGVVQMRFALGNSLNIPSVKILKYNGVEAMIATASAMGITTFKDPSNYGLSLTLGGGEVMMTDMATAYGVLANQGYRIDLHPILKVETNRGKVLQQYSPPKSPIFGKKVIPAGVAYIISHILLDNGARQEAFGSNSELRIGSQPVSVKTGTTNDLKDNWTIGYTPDRLVAVWVGNNDNTPMSSLTSGVTGAAPIWHDIMAHLLEGTKAKWPQKPANVIGKNICATSGLVPPADGTPDRCPTRFEYFIKGTEPKMVDPGKQKIFIDKATNLPAKPGQTENVEERTEYVITDPTGDRTCGSCVQPEPPKQ